MEVTPTPTPTKSTVLDPSQTSVETDRQALIALYHATDGPNWDRNDNWLSAAPIRDWYGITTDDDGRVIEIRFFRNDLYVEIAPELGNLINLERLDLDSNRLSGEIPPELGNLANLITLALSHNELSGKIPPELGNLANLVGLYLHGNELSGKIPPELGNLSNLEALYVNDTELTGCVPGSLQDQLDMVYSILGDLPFC